MARKASGWVGCCWWAQRRAERTVWETLAERNSFEYRAREMDQGAITLVLDLAEAFARVSLPVVCAWATRLDFCRCCAGA